MAQDSHNNKKLLLLSLNNKKKKIPVSSPVFLYSLMF